MNRGDEGLIELRLMNDYGAEIPLWGDNGQTDGYELDLSDTLRSDLAVFASRWEASIPAEVYDDRWDGVPVVRSLVAVRHSLRRLVNPAGRRSERAEDAEMRRLGEALRGRLQDELGSRYNVTYQH